MDGIIQIDSEHQGNMGFKNQDIFGVEAAHKFTIGSRKHSDIVVSEMPEDTIITIMYTS